MGADDLAARRGQAPVVGGFAPAAPRLGRFAPDLGAHTEFPHIAPLWTEMSPGGPQPFVHHDGAWILCPHRSLALTKIGLFVSMPFRFDVLPLPGSG